MTRLFLTFLIFAASLIVVVRVGGVDKAFVVGAASAEAAFLGYSIAVARRRGLTWFRLGLAVGRVRFRAGAAPAVPGVGMRVAAWLMPRAAGQEWLAEAYSVMFEAAPEVRRFIERSYLLAVGPVLVLAWAAALTGRLRAARGAKLPGGGR
jgi:hypothetical protein